MKIEALVVSNGWGSVWSIVPEGWFKEGNFKSTGSILQRTKIVLFQRRWFGKQFAEFLFCAAQLTFRVFHWSKIVRQLKVKVVFHNLKEELAWKRNRRRKKNFKISREGIRNAEFTRFMNNHYHLQSNFFTCAVLFIRLLCLRLILKHRGRVLMGNGYLQ